ncbi:Uncharacterised protein [uncultured archaeon]|nr:Uncharacterised protein [uncultured archaeon]
MLKNGRLELNGISIALDDASSDICFVSHAHSDHTEAFRKKGRSIIASDETFIIMGKEPQPRPATGIKLYPAGHMLGARQLRAETPDGTFVYTGDFALHDSYTAEAAPILSCDTLMIDSTYCSPKMRFPPRSTVLSEMGKFVKANERGIIVFGAYARGKSQELVRFLNMECGIAPIVCGSASRFCEAYEKCGMKLDYVAAGTSEAEAGMEHPFVAIMQPNGVNFQFGARLSEAFGMDVKTAVATGWALNSRFPVDAAFALSDHADFRDTMRYIHGSGAKKVICANSGSASAAAYLRSIGIDASEKSEKAKPQKTLAECEC